MKPLTWTGMILGGLGCGATIVVVLLLGSGFLFWSIDCDKTEVFNLTGNYRLGYFCEKRNMKLFYNRDEEYGGEIFISETVLQADWNDNWIIARQYGNVQEQISERLFNYSEATGDYELTDPADTIYLSDDDSIYRKDGKWYHISNGWNPPDTLYPSKRNVNYYIIDVKSKERTVYEAGSEERLQALRDSLHIPAKLEKQIKFDELK